MTRLTLFPILRRAFASLLLSAGLALAQTPPETGGLTSLAADMVRVEGNDVLVATGNVEIFYEGARMRAESLRYDRATDRLQVTGPITLIDGDGTVVFAEAGELQSDLESGLLTGARLILDQQLQIAGAEMARRNGRYSDLRQVAASSCETCREGETPLWDIRAKRVIHDEIEKQLYFYDARFRVKGIPIFYLPTLRVPDGSEDRVTGFLTPYTRTTTELGNGIKLPYFFVINDHSDLKLTPYIADDYTRTLEARYRQAFVNGNIEIEGAVSRDSIVPDKTRGYLFANGYFNIPHDFQLSFDVEATSDDPYLRDYDYSQKDRLDSAIGILRTSEEERFEAKVTHYQSLRADASVRNEPVLVGDLRWNQRMQPGAIGGWLDVDFIGHFHQRDSSQNIVGRDMAQLRGTLDWARTWTSTQGLRFQTRARVNADVKNISDDDRFPETQTALVPEGAVTLSWPLMARGADGANYTLEPVAQFAWTAQNKIDSPNDDSTAVALDTGNLFRLNRFPGLDRYEEGGRANLALRWSRRMPDGIGIALTGGKVYRYTNLDVFPEGSGLEGSRSDWLAQIDIDFSNRLALRNLTLLDSDFDPTLSETRLLLNYQDLRLSSSYLWESENRSNLLTDDVNEISANIDYKLNDTWSGELDIRRDFTAQRTNYAKLGVAYQNECVRVDFSARRSFRATSDVEPSYSYGISVSLPGFGSNETAARRRRCNS